MTETKTQTPAVLTPEFRGMYVHLFETQEADNGSKFYSIEALFSEGADLSRLKADATRAVKERWGADPAKWPKNLRSPFRDQGDFDKEGYTPGAQLCRFKRLADFGAPGVVDASAQSIIDPAQVYSGAYYRATVRAFAYPNPKNPNASKQIPGVSFGLEHVQKTRDGEPASGRVRAEDAFEPIAAAKDDAKDAGAASIFG